jgi:glyoxylase-like metal-dependent hydrolase (beta-lactamase superfamily II)
MSTRVVETPSLARCCSAFLQVPVGLVRPRRADRGFLGGIEDAGLPKASRTVRVHALRQVPKRTPTAMVVEGVRRPRRISIALNAFVIEHPEARILVDPGLCDNARRRATSQLPAVLRPAVGPPRGAVPTATALAERADAAPIDFALPTHLHWDHVCGLLDLPDLPVRLHQTEFDWATAGPVAPVGGVRDALRNRHTTTFGLDGPPVSTFTRSHDLFGDGAVVAVDLAGHTPGSVGILARTDTEWVLLAGDAAWHGLQIEKIRQKSSYPGALADDDRSLTFQTLHRLHAARSQLRIVPTHDHAAAQTLSN